MFMNWVAGTSVGRSSLSSYASRIAGQMIVWNTMLSLPTK